jgi:uncharacterized Zn finger protein
MRRLIAGQLDEAVRHATEGLARSRAAGLHRGQELRKLLREIAGKQGDAPLVAAYDAEEFFRHPSVHAFGTLLASARQAGCEKAVREAALRYLETGQRPEPGKPRKGAKAPGGWPLPPLSAGEQPGGPQKEPAPQPQVVVLLELAIVENRPDDVLHWYDNYAQVQQPAVARLGTWQARVADAVARTHPNAPPSCIASSSSSTSTGSPPSAYEEARPYL